MRKEETECNGGGLDMQMPEPPKKKAIKPVEDKAVKPGEDKSKTS